MAKTKDSLLLLLVATAIAYAVAADQEQQQCPDCGQMTVPYPLSTNSNCGNQSYKIRCESNTLIFNTINNSYPILYFSRFFPGKFVIQPANLTNNTCISEDATYNGFQLDPTLPFRLTSNNIVFFLNCTKEVPITPIDCSSETACYDYSNNASEAAACRNGFGLCCTYYKERGTELLTAYKIGDEAECSAYKTFVNYSPFVPQSGLELEWLQP